jgi:hypothetical protein
MDVSTWRGRGRGLEQELTITALKRAFERGVRAIHHPDQGAQYAATAYVELLTSHRVTISMASVGVPEENGYAERLMRTIKEDGLALTEYEDLADAWRQLGRFQDDVYNTKRIHSALGYLTPSEFEQQWLDAKCGRLTVGITINPRSARPVSAAPVTLLCPHHLDTNCHERLLSLAEWTDEESAWASST